MKSIIIALSLAGALFIMGGFIDRNSKIPENSKGFAVVELFTSEGCSSCPPADELIEKIQKDNKNKQVYILAFHVDYWDHQGWKDRFSNKEYSNRQRRYTDWLDLRTVYTPQIVINGTKEYVGSDRGPVLRAISDKLEQEPTQTLTLHGKVEGDLIHITHEGAANEKNTEMVLALIQKSAGSRVKAGENSGRDLSHVQIVREMLRTSLDKQSTTMKLPNDFTGKGWELIGFVQDKTDGHITSAARFEL